MAAEMLGLMYEHKGIGLAANQVDLPYRMFVCNLHGDPADRSEEYVFINPVIRGPKGMALDEEGCLSLPGLRAQVRRPEKVIFNAYTLNGEEFERELDGLFARMVQHELDHLDGVLFIDRLPPTALIELRPALDEFEIVFDSQRKTGEVLDSAAISKRLAQLEAERT